MISRALRLVAEDLCNIPRHVIINGLAGAMWLPRVFRFLIYRAWGMRVHTRNILGRVLFESKEVTIGYSAFINHGCIIDNVAPVSIGDWTYMAMDVLVCTTTHGIGGAERRAGTDTAQPVVIGSGCWIGARAVILPGVTVGDGCVIAAGAVVTRDCEPNGMYAGVPARRLKELPV